MGKFKDSARQTVSDYGSSYSAGKATLEWYDNAKEDRNDKAVDKITTTEIFESGKMYRFRYTPISKKRLAWYDKYPMIISLGQTVYKNSIVETGLNLNLLPYDVKVFFLDRLFHQYYPTINEQTTRDNVDQAKNQTRLGITFNDISHLSGEFGLGFAVRNYLRVKMRAAYVISYENWNRMILINEFYFSNANPKKVYAEYYKHIKSK